MNNKDITFRYSPGYGDLPLDVQSSFLRALDAQKKIGLTVSENNLLFPRKSVTAIIGIINSGSKKKIKSCKNVLTTKIAVLEEREKSVGLREYIKITY